MLGLPWWLGGKVPTCQCRSEFDSWVRKTRWRRKWQPASVFLPGKTNRQRILVGCSPWGHKESDTTEQVRAHSQPMNQCSPPTAVSHKLSLVFTSVYENCDMLTFWLIRGVKSNLILSQLPT